MGNEKNKLLIFALSRSGCLAYAHQMISSLQEADALVFGSAYAVAPVPVPHRKVVTYRNSAEFILNTFWILPKLFLQIRKAGRAGYQSAYFPVFQPWNLFIQLWCRVLGIRTFITVHDGILHPGENHPLLQWWESACIRIADELIFLSRFVEENTRRRIGFTGNAHVIPHGILGAALEPPERMLPPQPRLLFLGRIVRYKGIDLLVDAVGALPEDGYSHLTIAGMLVNKPVRTGNPQKIRWITHWLSEVEIAALLAGHDILVLPYKEASQSGVLTLGIGAAIPMLITRVGGLREQLGEEEAVWVAPDAESIRAGIMRLLSGTDLYGRLHQAMLRRRGDAGWKEAAAALEEIIFR